MNVRLKSKQLQIPGGFKFLQPETGWTPRAFSSFEGIVQALIQHRKGNQSLLAKGLSTDHREVSKEVEDYNVKVCQAMGWVNYVETGVESSPPKPLALSQAAQSGVAAAAGQIRKIWAGVKTLDEWLDSGQPGVDKDLAEKRAQVCKACPKNEKGEWSRWFTAPASEAIKRQIEKASSRKLSTSVDSDLKVCGVCLCPLQLSVHVPIAIKLAHLSKDVEAELARVKPQCWVITEKDAR